MIKVKDIVMVLSCANEKVDILSTVLNQQPTAVIQLCLLIYKCRKDVVDMYLGLEVILKF